MATGELSVRDVLGWDGITEQKFISELEALKLGAGDTIQVYVNSPGGSIFTAVSMMAAMSRHPAYKIMNIEGIAGSAASFFVMAGDEITIFEYGHLMVHAASSGIIGTAAEMRKNADLLDQLTDTIASIYANRSGHAKSDWLAAMAEETWINAEEFSAIGLGSIVRSTRAGMADPKARAAVANRSPHMTMAVNRLKAPGQANFMVDFDTRRKLSEYSERVRNITDDEAVRFARENRQRITQRASSANQRKQYLSWS